jgi:hypothetical protein
MVGGVRWSRLPYIFDRGAESGGICPRMKGDYRPRETGLTAPVSERVARGLIEGTAPLAPNGRGAGSVGREVTLHLRFRRAISRALIRKRGLPYYLPVAPQKWPSRNNTIAPSSFYIPVEISYGFISSNSCPI